MTLDLQAQCRLADYYPTSLNHSAMVSVAMHLFYFMFKGDLHQSKRWPKAEHASTVPSLRSQVNDASKETSIPIPLTAEGQVFMISDIQLFSPHTLYHPVALLSSSKILQSTRIIADSSPDSISYYYSPTIAQNSNSRDNSPMARERALKEVLASARLPSTARQPPPVTRR
uniref:Uncharacterized protein n=2 Tax=Moniliophthora roreri TaxID=221103 RepID=A0A0W0FWH6_MONRR